MRKGTHLEPLDDLAQDVVDGSGVAKVLRELRLAVRERERGGRGMPGREARVRGCELSRFCAWVETMGTHLQVLHLYFVPKRNPTSRCERGVKLPIVVSVVVSDLVLCGRVHDAGDRRGLTVMRHSWMWFRQSRLTLKTGHCSRGTRYAQLSYFGCMKCSGDERGGVVAESGGEGRKESRR